MRLYYFENVENGKRLLFTCPVGIGREGYSTALGIYTVRSKAKDPVWYVPPSVRKEDPTLPKRVEPGPDNPLGGYILRFSRLSYGIHGTNRPWGVGRRVSHGCIRLYPEDIEQLFPLVDKGTLILITYEPIKVGWDENSCWIQVYDDFNKKVEDPFSEALLGLSLCKERLGPIKIDLAAVKKALKDKSGIPTKVAEKNN